MKLTYVVGLMHYNRTVRNYTIDGKHAVPSGNNQSSLIFSLLNEIRTINSEIFIDSNEFIVTVEGKTHNVKVENVKNQNGNTEAQVSTN